MGGSVGTLCGGANGYGSEVELGDQRVYKGFVGLGVRGLQRRSPELSLLRTRWPGCIEDHAQAAERGMWLPRGENERSAKGFKQERERRRSGVGGGQIFGFEKKGGPAEHGFALPEAKEEISFGAGGLQEIAGRECIEAKVEGRGSPGGDGAVDVGFGAAEFDQRK